MKKIKVLVLIVCFSVFITGCSNTTVKKDSVETPKQNSSLQKNDENYMQAVNDYLSKINYKPLVNSGAGQKILLPNSFEAKFYNFNIGEFLNKRNEESKKNGLDFKEYLGKEVMLFTYASEAKQGDLVLLIYDSKVIGGWIDNAKANPDDFHVILTNTKNI